MDAAEFVDGKILACVEQDSWMYVINRQNKMIEKKVAHHFSSSFPTGISLLTDYNFLMSPTGFIIDKKCV